MFLTERACVLLSKTVRAHVCLSLTKRASIRLYLTKRTIACLFLTEISRFVVPLFFLSCVGGVDYI